MKTSSAKAKGRALQNYVRDKLRAMFLGACLESDSVDSTGLVEEDIQGRTMGNSGTDIILSPYAKKFIPWDIECKNVENLNIWKAWEQAKTNTQPGRKTLLIIKRNHSPVLAVQELNDVLR